MIDLQEMDIPYSEVGCKDCEWTPVKLKPGETSMKMGHYEALTKARRHSVVKQHRGFVRVVKTTVFIPEVANASE